jgi:hypothetical protein
MSFRSGFGLRLAWVVFAADHLLSAFSRQQALDRRQVNLYTSNGPYSIEETPEHFELPHRKHPSALRRKRDSVSNQISTPMTTNTGHSREWSEPSPGTGSEVDPPNKDLAGETGTESLEAYRRIPLSDRDWRKDAAFRALPEKERLQELHTEAVRDANRLVETIRHAVSDQERQRRLRDLMVQVESELGKEQYQSL